MKNPPRGLTHGAMQLALERIQDVLGALDESRATSDQVICATAARVERRPRYSEHLASLLKCEASGDKRSRSQRRLHHHDTQRDPGDQPIAARKMARLRFGPDRQLGDNRAGWSGAAAMAERSLPHSQPNPTER